MDQGQFQQSMPAKLRQISTALFALRDILVKLSLLLDDLQFQMNEEELDKAEAEFRLAFEKMRSGWSVDEFIRPR